MRTVTAAKNREGSSDHEVIVTIHHVDPKTSDVMGKDFSGSTLKISAQHRPKGVGLPDPGEIWRVRRRGTGWVLVEQINAAPPIDISSGSAVDVLSVLRQAGLVTGVAVNNAPTLTQWRIRRSQASAGVTMNIPVLTDKYLTSSLRGSTWADRLQEGLRAEPGGTTSLAGAIAGVGAPVIDDLNPAAPPAKAIGMWGNRGECLIVGSTAGVTWAVPSDKVTEIEVSMFVYGTSAKVTSRVGTESAVGVKIVSESPLLRRVRIATPSSWFNYTIQPMTEGPNAYIEVESVRMYMDDTLGGTWVDLYGQGESNAHAFAHPDHPIWDGDTISRSAMTIIAVGSTDAASGAGADLFHQDMADLVGRVLDTGALALVLVPPRPWGVDESRWHEYRATMFECARDYKTALLDLESIWPDYSEQSSGLRNGVELTEYGHNFIYSFLMESLGTGGR